MGNGIQNINCRKLCSYEEDYSRVKTIQDFRKETNKNVDSDATEFNSIANNNQTELSNEKQANFIEPYDSKNNFFYYMKKIIFIQRKVKSFLKRKQMKLANLGNLTQVEFHYYMRGDHNEKEGGDSHFEVNFAKFSTNPYGGNREKERSKTRFNPPLLKLTNHQNQNFSFNRFSSMNKLKQRYKVSFNHLPIYKSGKKEISNINCNNKPNGNVNVSPEKNLKQINEGCSLMRYMSCCQTSFKSLSRGMTNKTNGTVLDTDPRGCFLKKAFTFKFQGNVEVNTSKKEGFGKVTWKDESILLSFFKNNNVDGISYFNDKPNETEFSGHYFENHPYGYGLYKSNGFILEGEWKKNMLNGIGREYSENDTYYQGEFLECNKNGIGIYRWSDGTIYKGEWVDNQMTGYGIVIYNDDKVYLGQVTNGLMNGYGEFYWGNEGKKYFGFYENDLKHGFGVYVWNFAPMQAYMGFWEKGKMSGLGITIKNNKLRYGFWKAGKNELWLQGAWEMRKHARSSQMKFVKLMEKSPNKILQFIQERLIFD